jgi:hypothetical protein
MDRVGDGDREIGGVWDEVGLLDDVGDPDLDLEFEIVNERVADGIGHSATTVANSHPADTPPESLTAWNEKWHGPGFTTYELSERVVEKDVPDDIGDIMG